MTNPAGGTAPNSASQATRSPAAVSEQLKLDAQIDLPGDVDDVTVGGGGRFLLLTLRSLQNVCVFDVREAKILKYINVEAPHFFVAAGATQFVVVDSGSGAVDVWKYDMLEKPRLQTRISMMNRDKITGAAMGFSSEGPLGLTFSTRSQMRMDIFVEWYDLSTLSPIKYVPSALRRETRQSTGSAALFAAADGRSFSRIMDDRVDTNVFDESNVVFAISNSIPSTIGGDPYSIGFDGKTLHTRTSLVLPDGRKVQTPAGSDGILSPAVPPHFWVRGSQTSEKSSGPVEFLLQGSNEPVAVYDLKLPPPSQDSSLWLLPSKRFFYNADEKTLVVLPFSRTLHVKRFDLAAEIAKSKVDFLHVYSVPPTYYRPDVKFEYQIRVLSTQGDLKYRLESGPSTMTVSPNGRVEWMPPRHAPEQQVAIVSISDRSGESIFHNVTAVRIDRPAGIQIPPRSEAATARATSKLPASPAGMVGAPVGAAPNVTASFPQRRITSRPRSVIPLPDKIENLRCGGGRYVVGAIPTLRLLTLIDLEHRKLVKHIRLEEDDVRYAVGRSKLVVYQPNRGTLTRYNLATGEPELTVPSPVAGIYALTMGSDSEGPLIVSDRLQTSAPPFYLNLETLKPLEVEFETAAFAHYRYSPTPSISADGHRMLSGDFLVKLTVDGNQLAVNLRRHTGGIRKLSSDGNVIFDSKQIQDFNGLTIGVADQSAAYLPAVIGPLFLLMPLESGHRTNAGNPAICLQGDRTPVLTIDGLELGFSGREMHNGSHVIADEFLFVPTAHAIVSLSANGDRLNISRFDLDEELKKLDRDYFFIGSVPPAIVHPESKVEYQIEVRAKQGEVKYRLISGPPGMTVSTSGLVLWTPQGADREEIVATVEVIDGGGALLSHTFKIKIDAGASKQPAAGNGLAKPVGTRQNVDFEKTPIQIQTATFDAHPSTAQGVVARPTSGATPAPGAARAARLKQSIKLPAAVDDICVGGGGRYLVTKINSLRQVVIVDVAQKRILKRLPIDDDRFEIAASNTKLVVSMITKNILSRFDLATGEHERSVPRSAPPLTTMALGAASDGPILASGDESTGPAHEILNLQTLERVPIILQEDERAARLHKWARANADGRLFGSRRTTSFPPDINLFGFIGAGLRVFSADEGTMVLPSPDARFVYASHGLFTPRGRRYIGGPPRHEVNEVLLPAATGPLFMRLGFVSQESAQTADPSKAVIEVFLQGQSKPIFAIDDIVPPSRPEGASSERPAHPLLYDKRLFLLPAVDALVVTSPSFEELIVYRFDLDEELQRASGEYLFVTSAPPIATNVGSRFRYQIAAKANSGVLKYQLESGPAGLTVSPTGLVEWDAADVEPYQFVVTKVSDGFGHEMYYSFRIRLVGGTKPEFPLPNLATKSPIARPMPKTAVARTPTTAPSQVRPAPAPPVQAPIARELRKWSSADGQYSLEARMKSVAGDTVVLVRSSGESFEIKFGNLSKEDQAYVLKNR